MKVCNTERIDQKKGDFLILTDYGTEGLSVTSQHRTVNEAILNIDQPRQTIVRLVEFHLRLTD